MAAKLKGLFELFEFTSYSFHFWCERAYTFTKNIFFLYFETNKQAQVRCENVMQK